MAAVGTVSRRLPGLPITADSVTSGWCSGRQQTNSVEVGVEFKDDGFHRILGGVCLCRCASGGAGFSDQHHVGVFEAADVVANKPGTASF